MSKKPVFLMFLAIILIGLVIASFHVHKVEAQLGTIYIRADGSIDPSTANITSLDNVTYTLTGNIDDEIVVERNDVFVDGAGYAVQSEIVAYSRGIDLTERSNVTIKNLAIGGFSTGIYLNSSSHNSIVRNTLTNNFVSITVIDSLNNTIAWNNITSYLGQGIFVDTSYNNIITGNNIYDNRYGIEMQGQHGWPPDRNIIVGNNFTGNIEYGVFLYLTSNDNIFYHNNFMNNTHHASTYPGAPSLQSWDNGIEGNYWSNYTGADANHDGIGDASHVLDSINTDYYPLMGPFHSFDTSLGKSVNVISNSTVDSFQYESPSTIRFHVSNTTASQTHGFCRLSIPYEVLSAPFNVTIDGANPTYWNYTLYDNGTHRWIYFEYEHTTREIVIIPEFPSFLILPLFMIATLLAVKIYRKKQ